MKINQLFYFVLITIAAGCHPGERMTDASDISVQTHLDTIQIQANADILKKIVVTKIEEQYFRKKLTCAGIVKVIPGKYAKVATPFPGRVIKSFVKLGEKVNEGAPLFAISSSDFFNTQKNYFDAKEEYKKSEMNLKRQQDLIKNNVGVQKELEEAETDFATKKTALENAAAALKLFNIDPHQLTLGDPLIIRSPINGEIIENKIVLGEYLKEDAEPIIVVADLSKVWIAGKIKEKDIDVLNNLDEVEIFVSAYPDKKFKGHLFYIGQTVDEETRSIDVLIETDNAEKIFKPGMYVTVNFYNKPEKKIMIPNSAILQASDYPFVLLQKNSNVFIKKKIKIESSTKDSSVIKEGLMPHQKIITQGAIYLIQNTQ